MTRAGEFPCADCLSGIWKIPILREFFCIKAKEKAESNKKNRTVSYRSGRRRKRPDRGIKDFSILSLSQQRDNRIKSPGKKMPHNHKNRIKPFSPLVRRYPEFPFERRAEVIHIPKSL
jgi:hypothetical protein